MITNIGQRALWLFRNTVCSEGNSWASVFAAAVSVVALFLLFWRSLYFRIWSWLHPDEPEELPYWIPGKPFHFNREVMQLTQAKSLDMHYLTSRTPMERSHGVGGYIFGASSTYADLGKELLRRFKETIRDDDGGAKNLRPHFCTRHNRGP